MDRYWLVILPLSLVASSLGPGLLVLRRLRLSPPERLVAAAGISFVLLYVASFALYVAGAGPIWHCGLTLAYAAATAACVVDLRRLFRRRAVRAVLIAHAAVLVWGLVLLSFVRHYGGGTWSGDWLEHYQRSLFFLEHRPTSTHFIDQYLLPARPPMMNVLVAHFLALTGPGYPKFQLVSLYLNALVVPACCLLAFDLSRSRPPVGAGPLGRAGPVLALLVASPFVAQNLTYGWTKLLCAFYVMLAVHLYLRWLRRRQARYIVLTFVSLAAGCLVHYSAGPYALFIALHYAAQLLVRRARWWEALGAGAVSAALLATWFAWSVYAFGARTTFGSNSTVTDSASMSAGDNMRNIARNGLNSIVPVVLRHPEVLQGEDLRQPSDDGRLRDFGFLVYQVTLPFALGTGGLVLMLHLIGRRLPRGLPSSFQSGAAPRDETWFWILFVPFTFVVGVVVCGGIPDRFGVAHVTLQPLALLALAAVGAHFQLAPLPLRRLIILFLLVDFALGIVLHFNLQSRDFETETGPDGRAVIAYTPQTLSRGAQSNWAAKQREGLSFFADPFKGYLGFLQVLLMFSFGSIQAVGLRPYLTRAGAPPQARGVSRRAAPRSG